MSIIGLGRDSRDKTEGESWKVLTLSEEMVVHLKMECATLQHETKEAVFILIYPSLLPKTYITTTKATFK